jgi:NAD(P)-dependent dehydrogenase (short-subunit alcohol dehydrogenase family)
MTQELGAGFAQADVAQAQASVAAVITELGRVDEIADFVVFLLSGRSGVVTGSVIDWDQNVLGGMD